MPATLTDQPVILNQQQFGGWLNRLKSANSRLANGDSRCHQYSAEFGSIISEMAEAATTMQPGAPPGTPLDGRVT